VDREAIVSTDIRCDGCGHLLGNDRNPNYWHATFMGDTIRSGNGTLLDTTGLLSRGYPLSKADVCIPCMSKTQEEKT
jgi:hypothetical protein